MSSRTTLGKLIKQVRDTHDGFIASRQPSDRGTPLSLREKREYEQVIARHHSAVEAKVSFNPYELFRVRRLANRYLRRFDRYH